MCLKRRNPAANVWPGSGLKGCTTHGHTVPSGLLPTSWHDRCCSGELGQAGEVPAHQGGAEPHGQQLTSIVPWLFCPYLTPNSYICSAGRFSADDSLGLLAEPCWIPHCTPRREAVCQLSHLGKGWVQEAS